MAGKIKSSTYYDVILPYLSLCVQNMDAVVARKPTQKFLLYSGHDSTCMKRRSDYNTHPIQSGLG